jgi:hypothetical protein
MEMLPNEILNIIFKHALNDDLNYEENISLTCKKWYKILQPLKIQITNVQLIYLQNVNTFIGDKFIKYICNMKFQKKMYELIQLDHTFNIDIWFIDNTKYLLDKFKININNKQTKYNIMNMMFNFLQQPIIYNIVITYNDFTKCIFNKLVEFKDSNGELENMIYNNFQQFYHILKIFLEKSIN